MTVNDLLPLIREDLLRVPFTGQTVETDTDAAQSYTGTPSNEDLEQRILDARDALLPLVKAQHLPGCIQQFTGSYPYPAGAVFPTGVVRVLPSRVYEAGYSAYETVTASSVTYGVCIEVAMEQIIRRGVRSGVFAVEGGRLCVPGGNALFYGINAPAFTGRDDDLGVDARLQRAIILHVCASLWTTWKEGRAILAWQDFYRQVRPYARKGISVEQEVATV